MIRTIAVLGYLFVLAPVADAQVKDPAALFPADTPVYAEISKPGDLADVLAAWAKKTSFADPLARTHDAIEKEAQPQTAGITRVIGAAGMLASPEMFAELKRFPGVGFGFTGFSKDHRPEFALAVLTGDSNLAGLAVRAFLTGNGSTRRVDTVEGVTVFQHRGHVGPVIDGNGQPFQPDDEANPLRGHKPMPGTGEPTYAYTPGLFVVGSSPEAVGGVLKRFTGKEKSASLAESELFKKSNAERGKGVFLYAVPPELGAKLDAEKKAGGKSVPTDFAALLRFVVNAKAVPVVTGNVIFKPDSVGLVVSANVDASAESPLLGLLAGGTVTADGFRFAGKESAAAFTLALPAAAERGKAIVRFLDSIAKANGALGKLPGETLQDADRDLLAGLSAITVFAPTKQELPAGGLPFPMLVLHCDSDAAAGKWVDAVARLAQIATGAEVAPTPSSESIGGVKVVSVACAGFPWNAPVHAAKAGSAVVVGLDRKLVAVAAVSTTGVKPPEFDGPSAGLGVIRPTAFPDPFVRLGNAVVRSLVPSPNGNPGTVILDDLVPNRGPFAPPPLTPEEDDGKKPAPVMLLKKAATALPPVVVRLSRTGTTVKFEVWQRGLDTGLGPLVDGFVAWLERAILGVVNGQQPGVAEPIEKG